MKRIFFLSLLTIFFSHVKAQDEKQKQQVKSITLQAFESVSQSTRQWFADINDQHPPGDFDTAYATRRLKERFSVAQLSEMGDMFVVMMAYLKMVQKEAREDRKLASMTKEIMLASKAKKLELDNKAIDQGMKESREKAEQAMDAATTQLVTAIISSGIQIAGASVASQGAAKTALKDTTKSKIRITASNKVPVKLSLPLYIKKLETQLAILKKGQH